MNSNIPFHVPIEKNEKFQKKFFAIFWVPGGWRPEPIRAPFFRVWDGNSKIATVTPILCLWCTPSQKISPIGPVVWAVRGGAGDLGCSSSCIYASSVHAIWQKLTWGHAKVSNFLRMAGKVPDILIVMKWQVANSIIDLCRCVHCLWRGMKVKMLSVTRQLDCMNIKIN